jgi:ElaB/YqjD/DUF883 family membrane-anchored ribosome-binding protein
MNTINLFFVALISLMNQYGAYLKSKRENEIDELEDQIDELEDQIDALAANGSPASKLRMERLVKRLKRKVEQLSAVYTGNSNTD